MRHRWCCYRRIEPTYQSGLRQGRFYTVVMLVLCWYTGTQPPSFFRPKMQLKRVGQRVFFLCYRNMQRIIFRIDQDGNVTEEVQGVTNDTCIDITKEIEDTLGNVKSRELKSEYYQKQNVSLHQHQNETEG